MVKFSEVSGVTNFKPFFLGKIWMKICHQKSTEFFTLGGGGKNVEFHHLDLLGAALRKLCRAKAPKSRRRAEYGFGEYGFKQRAHWVFWSSPSLSSYLLCAKTNSLSFAHNSPSVAQSWVIALLRNRTLETACKKTMTKTNKISGKVMEFPSTFLYTRHILMRRKMPIS